MILSHSKPEQLKRLFRVLDQMFCGPPIVCHHDFAQCPLDLDDVPSCVTFVQPHLSTSWADFSVVEATVVALRLLYSRADSPDWVFVLSGTDYPVRSAHEVLERLENAECDAFIHYELIDPADFARDWQRRCYRRYCTAHLHLPFPTRLPGGRWAMRRRTLYFRGFWARPFLPFTKRFRCFAGSQWFTANRNAVAHILAEHSQKPRLVAHYRSIKHSDESYIQVILANASHLVLCNSYLRYIDWSENGPHPKLLTLSDLPDIERSDALFARKFDMDTDPQVLDTLDRQILAPHRTLQPHSAGEPS